MVFVPLLPPLWLLLFTLLATAVVCVDHVRLRRTCRPAACRQIVLCRLLLIAATVLLLAPPQRQRHTPQTDKLKAAVCVDLSGSMNVLAASGDARRIEAERALNDLAEQAEHSSGGETADWALGRREYYGFADTLTPLRPQPDGRFRLPEGLGGTRLGEALAELLRLSDQGTPLSSVILLTDGRWNGNLPPLDVARRFREKRLPISVIGTCSQASTVDFSVKAAPGRVKAVRNTPFTLTCTVTAAGGACQGDVELWSDGAVVERQPVTVTTDGTAEVTFQTQYPLAGFHTYCFRLQTPNGDGRADNDMDYTAVEITEPPFFRILYLSYGMDWEWRFLRGALENQSQFKSACLLQTGPDVFTAMGWEPPLREGTDTPQFPETAEAYDAFDVVIVNGALLTQLNERQGTALRSFVEYKGGGLLVRGTPGECPEALAALLPGKACRQQTVSQPLRLVVLRELAFRQDTARLLEPPRGIWVQPLTVLDTVETPRRSLRPLVCLGADDGPAVVAAHAFGAGRVVFSGLYDSWRWALAGKPTADIHAAFWHQLLVWLAETGRPTLSLPDNGARLTAGEPHTVQAEVLGADFRPAEDARVTVAVTAPSGKTSEQAMLPSPDELGRYTLELLPEEAGEYRLNVTSETEGRTLSRTASLLAVHDSRENGDTSGDETLLQDLARLTGGIYIPADDFHASRANIPVSVNVPMMETRQNVFPPWLLFALFAVTAGLAWWSRRRLGLK